MSGRKSMEAVKRRSLFREAIVKVPLRWIAAVAIVGTIPALSGCLVARLILDPPGKRLVVGGYKLPAPQPIRMRLRAGVGRADITPPAGYPNGGDGPAGNLARGYWARLYARAYFFQDQQGRT